MSLQRSHPRHLFVCALALVALLTSACGDATVDEVAVAETPAESSPPAPAAEAPVVAFTVADYLIDAPVEPVPAGVVTLELTNTGEEFHHLQLWRVDDADRAAEAIRAGDLSPLALGWAAGGVGAIEGSGTVGRISTYVRPGEYVAFCLIHTPAGAHNELGMVSTLDVVGEPVATDFPAADHELVITPTGFELPESWDGSAPLAVVNRNLFPTDAEFLRLVPGTTAEDFLGFMDGSVPGPPPFTVAGGVSGLRSDATSIVLDELVPGDYLLASFSPNPLAEMAPQFMTGHLAEFTVS